MLSKDKKKRLHDFFRSPGNQDQLESLITLTGVNDEPFNKNSQDLTNFNLGRASVGRELKKFRTSNSVIADQ